MWPNKFLFLFHISKVTSFPNNATKVQVDQEVVAVLKDLISRNIQNQNSAEITQELTDYQNMLDMNSSLTGPLVESGVRCFSLLTSNPTQEQIVEIRKEMTKAVGVFRDFLQTQPGLENLEKDVSFPSDPRNLELIQKSVELTQDLAVVFRNPGTGQAYFSDVGNQDKIAYAGALAEEYFLRLLSNIFFFFYS